MSLGDPHGKLLQDAGLAQMANPSRLFQSGGGSMLKEFKEFAMRGNVLDMAIGIIIGAAFGRIITSFVQVYRKTLLTTWGPTLLNSKIARYDLGDLNPYRSYQARRDNMKTHLGTLLIP